MLLEDAIREGRSAEDILNQLKSQGQAILICDECKKPFFFYEKLDPAKQCPTCLDRSQGRPEIVQERNVLQEWQGVEIASLPLNGEWEEVRHGHNFKRTLKDGVTVQLVNRDPKSSYKLDIKGTKYGAKGSGRIVIFADLPFKTGDIVDFREMEVAHLTRVRRVTRPTMHHGEVTSLYKVPFDEGDYDEEVIETRRYLKLSTSETPVSGVVLIWAIGYTKTTLKGFGRQYYHQVSGAPLFKKSITGGSRSGRYYTEGILALVNNKNWLKITGTGDIQHERYFPEGIQPELEA